MTKAKDVAAMLSKSIDQISALKYDDKMKSELIDSAVETSKVTAILAVAIALERIADCLEEKNK